MSDTHKIDIEELSKKAQELNIDINEVLQKAMNDISIKKTIDSQSTDTTQSSTNKMLSIPQQKLDEVWARIQIVRHQDRPNVLEYIDQMSDQYMELHGDRYASDDKAMVGGICTLDGIHFTFIGTQKGSNMKENIIRNYGMAHPEGYRKALRLAKQAEHFGRPLLSLIDTSGAYPGLASEERGIGEAIARNIQEFSMLAIPVICIIIGEAGSGGALGICIGDKIFMLENSVYSVISPEGFASILLRDAKRSKEAATLMKMTAQEIMEAGFIDGIIPEPLGGAHEDFVRVADSVKSTILNSYHELKTRDVGQLLSMRSRKILNWTRNSEQQLPVAPKDLFTKIRDYFSN